MAHDAKTRAILAQLSETHGGMRLYIPKRKPLPEQEIKAAREAGKSCRQIARELGCGKSAVGRRGR